MHPILFVLIGALIASLFCLSLITGGYHGKRAAWLLMLVLALVASVLC